MTKFSGRLHTISQMVSSQPLYKVMGRVIEVGGLTIVAAIPDARKGMIYQIDRKNSAPVLAEVTKLEPNRATLTPYSETTGLSVGALVRFSSEQPIISVGFSLLGRIVNPFGEPMDGLPLELETERTRHIRPKQGAAVERPVITKQFHTGCRAIDGTTTIGVGQRMAVFGAPGTGKSSLLEMLASNCEADVIVVGLVGERGREVREFFEQVNKVGKAHRLVIVAATSDRPAIERAICAHSASSIAEYFRDQGKSVFLVVDSLTRTARALREIGLANGEAPVRRGFPASVYPALSAVIERAGRSNSGDITALYSVLTEGDAETDPIGEEVKSLTDGHILLSRELANAGHFPSIDVLASLSRTMKRIVTAPHLEASQELRKLLAKYEEIELLLKLGDYEFGYDPVADKAIQLRDEINSFIRQASDEYSNFPETVVKLRELVS
ncbi:FliI/YscN family ATPase [Parasedimentitalea maritima]|uniref:FliI/YscN family ATPase n=1 Tax=Parasedimentitalea maritima TaxID=2578117 RepID=A0ABY2UNE1_9RHOB|nr:FliI/YscN family ATPase [Zongyanglinia marina]TLP55327.1 FliI/YscN family ATPase [Zongyanglinia marina]